MTTSDDTTLPGSEAPEARAERRPRRKRLRSGERLGRYTVLDLLGQGGMGLVYAAYDPQLDRRVAVKLLRAHRTGASSVARQRLMREAQAMAKLSHPNVVTVHDVGTVDGEIFVAMEFVDGPTLERWLEQDARSPAQIVEVFVQAGRGLAAAHAAGMVHRDFKPANVLIDAQGRARVTDFGLVRTRQSESDELSSRDSGLDSGEQPAASSLSDAKLTDADRLLGTPAYMAPEQHLGLTVDARTDQFGFCVALFEALFGEHPFGGTTVLEMMSAVSQGDRRDPPPSASVPAPIRRAVLRGLQHAPADRWPDMNALIDALLDDPGQRRRRWALLATGALALAGLTGTVALAVRPAATSPEPAGPCDEAGREIDRVWSVERHDKIGAAFAATGRVHAPGLWSRGAAVIDAYAERWRSSAVDACEATRVRGEQSDSLFDLRRRCLNRRLDELDARLTVLTTVDDGLLDVSFTVATALNPVAACEDAEHLQQRVPLPEEPERAQRVQQIQKELANLTALLDAGSAATILPRADALVEQADATRYPPVQAETRLKASSVHEAVGHWQQAEQLLRDAARYAGEGRDDHMLARIWVSMPYLVGYLQGRLEDAELLRAVAEAALARIGSPPAIARTHAQGLGALYLKQGQPDKARTHYERALRLSSDEDADALPRASTLNNLAVLQMQQGFFAEARELFDRSLNERRDLLRPDHPDFADLQQNLSFIAASQGDYDVALEHLAQALRIARAAQPDGGPQELSMLLNQISILARARKLAEARRAIEEAEALADRLLEPDHPHRMVLWANRAEVERAEGNFDEARRLTRQAYELAESTYGAEHHEPGVVIFEQGKIEMDAGQLDAARELMDRALARLGAGYPEDDPAIAEMHRWRASLDLALGDRPAAAQRFERVIDVLTARQGNRRELARARFGLARSLPKEQRARARELASAAKKRLEREGLVDEVAKIDAWLRENP